MVEKSISKHVSYASEEKPNDFELDLQRISSNSPCVNLLAKKQIWYIKLDDKSKSGIEVPNPILFAIRLRFFIGSQMDKDS